MSNIDDLFKKAINSQSEPYNPAAWEKISKKLDAGIPARKNPFLKWGLPSVAVLVGAAATWYYSNGSSIETSEPVLAKENNKTEQVAQNKENKQETSEVSTPEKTEQNRRNDVKNVQSSFSPVFEQEKQVTETTETKIAQTKDPSSAATMLLQPTKTEKIEQEPIQHVDPKRLESFTALSLPSCENEGMDVQNSNAFGIVLRSKDYEVKISANSSKKVKLSEGNYEIIHAVSGVSLQNHSVTGVSNTEVVVGDLYYSAGLPYRHASIKTENTIMAISAQGTQVTCCNKELEMLSFTKGNYALNIETISENGCRRKSIETFYVSEDYNLLAVNAFEPLSQDSRKSTFIPFALTQRETPFRMIIIDPSDGGIVYETTDALLPWDGIDKRTGKLADTNKAYVWKVNLSKPEPGEKVDYMGTVVRM